MNRMKGGSVLLGAAVVLAAGACGGTADGSEAEAAGQDAAGFERIINVEVMPLQLERFVEQVRLTGVVQADRDVTVSAEEAGRVVEVIVDKGARVVTGGKRHSLGGTFFQPTVLADATPEMAVAREEIFGPVSPLFRFETEAEALRMANDTEYGLAAYFYTRDMARIWRVAEGLEYGIHGINTGLISTAVAPFGGVKESGIGREGSKYGLEEFLEVKYLCLGGINTG